MESNKCPQVMTLESQLVPTHCIHLKKKLSLKELCSLIRITPYLTVWKLRCIMGKVVFGQEKAMKKRKMISVFLLY